MFYNIKDYRIYCKYDRQKTPSIDLWIQVYDFNIFLIMVYFF